MNTEAKIDLSLADYYQRHHKSTYSLHYYQQAQYLSPHYDSIQNNYGVLLCRHKRYETAIAELRQAMNNPHYIHRNIAAYNLKICQNQRIHDSPRQ